MNFKKNKQENKLYTRFPNEKEGGSRRSERKRETIEIKQSEKKRERMSEKESEGERWIRSNERKREKKAG